MKTKSKPSPATAKRAAYPQVTTRHHSQGKLSYQIQSLKDADDGWMAKFKRQGIKAPRLLVMNDSPSGDRLTSLVIHLGIRSEKRIYVADPPSGQSPDLLRRAYSRRMDAAAQSPHGPPLLLDAQILDGVQETSAIRRRNIDIRIPSGNAPGSQSRRLGQRDHGFPRRHHLPVPYLPLNDPGNGALVAVCVAN